MTNNNLRRWLLVAIAILALAVAAPAVSAHGDEPAQGNETAADGMPADADSAGWATWMADHMTDYMGPDAIDEMESHMGVSIGEMSQYVADEDHRTGMNGQRHGC